MLQIKVKKGSKKGSKFGNSLSEQTEPKVSQNSLPTVLRNRHVVRPLIWQALSPLSMSLPIYFWVRNTQIQRVNAVHINILSFSDWG